jgi:hypothetical protein
VSGHLFPLTNQERQQWKAEEEAFMKVDLLSQQTSPKEEVG